MIHSSLVAHSELIVLTLAGLTFGLLYFATLKRTVTLFVGNGGWLGPLALTLARVGGATGLFFVAAKLGASSLLAAFIGFLMARALALRAERRAG